MAGVGWMDPRDTGYEKEGLAGDLLALCATLGLERFALAGHDWGGFVAFVAADRAFDRVPRPVLMKTGHGFLQVDLRLLATQVGFR